MLHERDAKHPWTDGDGQRRWSVGRAPATVQWDATTSSPHQKEQQRELMSRGEPDAAAEVNLNSDRYVSLFYLDKLV